MHFFEKKIDEKVQHEINRINSTRIHKLIYVVMVMEAFMILFSFFIKLPNYYKYSYISLFILSFIFSYLTQKQFQTNYSMQKIVINFAIYIFSFWGIIIAILDSFLDICPYVYLINISAIACFLISTPKESIVYNLVNFTILLLSFGHFNDLSYPFIINIVCFHLVLLAISIDRYIIFSKSIVDNFFLKKANKELEILSTIDQLSGCKNRRGLLYEIEKYSGQVFFILLTDIDNFKEVNDLYGHDIGDLFIVNFAKILQSNFGINNVFRIGGDEFIIINNQDPMDYCLKKFKTSCRELEEISFVTHANLKMTTSAGYTYKVINNEDDFNILYKQLDIALYNSKKAGKNQIFKVED